MLVAFEAGGLFRALILLLLHPFLRIIGEYLRIKLMVFICFFGLKKKTFRIGRSVLAKLLLENVGNEALEIVMKFGKKVAVSNNLPRIMIESFLVDYLGVDDIVGREIKVVGGYYVGILENKGGEENIGKDFLDHSIESQIIGIGGNNTCFKCFPFMYCQDIYLLSKYDKKWSNLPREKYPKPLLFHDGRLAFEPTPLSILVMFIWLPFAIFLCILRIMISYLLPYKLSLPLLAYTGIRTSSNSFFTNYDSIHDKDENSKGIVYVCNHKTVIDGVAISVILRTNLKAITYSVSKASKIIAPIEAITLTRHREKDAEIMKDALNKGNIMVCPEGTTCREPYLLRFSPLFAELSDDIVPVGIQVHVSMFYGTTASGIKALDPIFFLLNPWASYYAKFLEKLPKSRTCRGGGVSKFEVANHVQAEIGKALGYECTSFTRKDKYLVLAGNNGVVTSPNV